MESVIFLGLMGVGYLINKESDDKHKVHSEVQPPLFVGSGNSVYDQATYSDAKRHEIELANKHHELSMGGDSKVIDSTNRGGRNTLSDTTNKETTIQSISGETFSSSSDFLTNDQGIQIEPFFNSPSANINLDESTSLMNHQGGSHAYRQSRSEVSQFFELERDYGNVYGNNFEGVRADQSRYIGGMNRKNELPFEQEKVVHIDINSDINRDIGEIYARRNTVENLRTLNNQKENYGGKLIHGKGIDRRGEVGEVFQHSPDADYVNTADKWLVTTGAIDAPLIQPTNLIKDTNRANFNEGKLGPAAPVNFNPSQERPMFKKSTNQQLEIETNRNMNLEQKASVDDYNKNSYFAYPNEREVTTERTYEGNIKSIFTGETERLYDEMKPSKKQTTNFEYSGDANSYLPGSMAGDKFLRAELNPNKEIISRGREPTPEKTKLTNGMDTLDVDIHKIESDYFNPRINNMDKLYSELPSDDTCEYTRDKDTLDNVKLSDRLDPTMLDPFKENPYTHSLASFAY